MADNMSKEWQTKVKKSRSQAKGEARVSRVEKRRG
jgi:hypothetical protein